MIKEIVRTFSWNYFLPQLKKWIKFSIKDFFSKCDQTCSFLRIWLHLLKKYFMENFIFCAVSVMFPYPGKYSWGISYEYGSGWPELTGKIFRLCLCHALFYKFLNLHVSQAKKCRNTCFLLPIFPLEYILVGSSR